MPQRTTTLQRSRLFKSSERTTTQSRIKLPGIDEFREIEDPLIPMKVEFEAKIASITERKTNRLEPLRNRTSAANILVKTASEDNWVEMKTFLKKVGSNCLLRDKQLTVSFPNPLETLT